MKNWELILIIIGLHLVYDDIPSLEAKERALTVCLQGGYTPQVCQKIFDEAF